jgi:transcriptional regulator with XRE-family HTH domain
MARKRDRQSSKKPRKEDTLETIIGRNIKLLRKSKAWTQEHLAGAAEVSTRTVQRAEAGHPVLAEHLQALAGAFDVEIDLLRTDLTSIAERVEAAAANPKPMLFVPVERVQRPSELLRFLGSELFLFDAASLHDDVAGDLAAQLNEDLRDMNDLHEDVGPVECREWAKRVFGLVERLQERGIAVGHGQHRGKWRQRSNPDAPDKVLRTYIVVLMPEAEFKAVVAWDVSQL